MSGQQELLQVYQAGELTVLGFGGQEIIGQIDISKVRAQLLEVIRKHGTQTMAFDLRKVKLLPSGMLGLMASLLKMKVAVHVYNPSPDVREVLKVTGLTKVISIHELEESPGHRVIPATGTTDLAVSGVNSSRNSQPMGQKQLASDQI